MGESGSASHFEIEAKFRVDDHEPIRARLRQLGAEPLGRVLETNHIFDDESRSLLAGQRGLRVRACHEASGRLVSATLTYKGPPIPSSAKQRQEIETEIGDPDAAVELVRALGFVEVVRFEKWRETWQCGAARVELDLLPHLGCFVEIEAPDCSQVVSYQNLMSISPAAGVSETYVALVANHCQQSGLDPLGFRFSH